MANPAVSSYASWEQPSATASSADGAQPFVILDFLFPGFSVLAGAVQRYLHINLNLYIPLVILVGALILVWNYSSQHLWEQLENHFMSVVDIRTDDEIYNILMGWVATQSFAQKSRRFVVNTDLTSRSWHLWRWDDEEEEDDDIGGGSAVAKSKKNLSYTPSFGSHYFWYRGRMLMFRRSANKEQNSYMLVSEKEEISISYFGRNPWILKELIHEARQKYLEKDQNKTLIYRGTTRSGTAEPQWQRCMARVSRPFSTVILNEKTKQDLIEDVTDYLQPTTQRWYANRGIPYRRGYLLYGPPGTGKSSLSLALAGFFKMRIYIVSLSSITATEENLATLFAELPRRCVVLLEDIDTAGLTHTRDGAKDQNASAAAAPEPLEPGQTSVGNGSTTSTPTATPAAPPGRLSLSGLLNILDGVASQEGRVLIMTTNHLEKLDRALIRPGRVDMIVEFGLADAGMTASIFRAIFAHLEGDDGPQVLPTNMDPEVEKAQCEETAKKRAADKAHVDALALEFASKIPAHEFSPAELQGHLMRYKRSPQTAIDKAEEFIEQTRKDRKEKEIRDAEEKRKAEEERKKKEAKEAEDKKKKQQKKKKRREAKSSSTASDTASGSESSSKEDKSGSGSDSASESESGKQKKSKRRHGSSKKTKKDTDCSSATVLEDTPKDAKVVTQGHGKKDSGYGTPSSVDT
ncbi:BCS1 N terminal-domain-containing protein [Apiospora marii]|uniref:BCS1 N terminal-domain-containing protein n=1 Tax=Apiospora marii TaxID=335849 RepID=A0ABR1RZU1_9PEZI